MKDGIAMKNMIMVVVEWMVAAVLLSGCGKITKDLSYVCTRQSHNI